MQVVQIRDEALTLMRQVAGGQADRYVSDLLLPSLRRTMSLADGDKESVRLALADPLLCLHAIYGHYAFSRRGKDRGEMADMAGEALDRVAESPGFESFLKEPHAGRLWEAYVEVCQERRKKPLEQLNLGVIAGIAELAQETYREDGVGSIAEWVVRKIVQTGRIEPQFLRMVDVRGVGPKLTSLILRDVVFFSGLEDRLDHADRLYVQPIDKWIRIIAPYIVDEVDDDAADWVLAGKLAKYTRRGGVSGIRFNMGVTAFGLRQSRTGESVEDAIEALVRPGRA